MSLTLFYAGPPEVIVKVSLTPMAPLRSALEQAISKMSQVRPPLDANSCQILLHEGGGRGGGKPVTKSLDLACPLRHANFSSTARIEVVRSSPTSSIPAASPRPIMTQPLPDRPPPPEVSAPILTPINTSDLEASDPLTDNGPGAHAWQSLGLDRAIAVFTKQQLDDMMATSSGPNAHKADEADDFFELTPEDLAIMRQSQEVKKKEEAILKTRALREADETRKAASYGSVPLRVHFPSPTLGTAGTIIIQAAFSPLEPVSAVKQLISKLVHPSIGQGFQLFTTPPRFILKDTDASLFKSQLVPAANLHFTLIHGDNFQESSFLKEEVVRMILPSLDFNVALPGQDRSNRAKRQEACQTEANYQNEAGAGSSSMASNAAEQKVEGGGPGRYLGGAKLPKWMKL